MMKKNILRLMPLIALSVSLQSCRTNEDYASSKDEVYYSNKFQVFTQPDKNGKIDYPNGFAFLFKEYDRIHESNFTGLKISENHFLQQKGEIMEKHVDFSRSSQPIKLDNGQTWVYFPVVENGKVTDVIVGVLRDEETFVEFGTLNQKEEYNQMVLERFRTAYLTRPALVSRGGKPDPPCGGASNPCDIGEIDIPPPRGPYLPTFNVGTYPGQGGVSGGNTQPPGGGCSMYENCGGNPPEPKNPCDKTKEMLNSQKNKDITKSLSDHMASGLKGEKGWRDNKAGAPTQTTQNSDHSVNFGDPSTMNGGYHNHTGTGVNIFSATDIATLIEIARYQSIGNTGNGYMGIMAPGGIHYVIYFNGNHGSLPISGSYNQNQLDNWNKEQWKKYLDIIDDNTSINQKIEQIFFSTLGKMGLQNKVVLQKVDDNKVYTVNQNLDGTTIPDPCNN